MKENNVISAFSPIPGVKYPGIDASEPELVTYGSKEIVKKTGPGDDDYIIKKVQVVKSKVDRAEYINSFKDDVGIMNVMKKVQLTGNVDLLNQRGLVNNNGIVDITKVPKDLASAKSAVKSGIDAFNSLPEEIKGKMSFEEFAKNYTNAMLAEYLKTKQPGEKKEDVKDGEQ